MRRFFIALDRARGDDERQTELCSAGPPALRPPVRVIEPEPWDAAPHLPAVAAQRVELVTTYTDRARATCLVLPRFRRQWPPALWWWQWPALGRRSISRSVAGHDGRLSGDVVDLRVLHTPSARDVALTQSMMGYRLLREEQKERHRRMRRWEEREEGEG